MAFDAKVANAGAFRSLSHQRDQFNSVWLSYDATVLCIGENGTIKQTLSSTSITTAVANYIDTNKSDPFAAPANAVGVKGEGGVVFDGTTSYFVWFTRIYQSGFNYYDVMAVHSIASDGTLTIEGVVWIAALTTVGDAAGSWVSLDACAGKTHDDPLLVWRVNNAGAVFGLLWPAINTVLTECSPCNGNMYTFTDYSAAGLEGYGLFGPRINNGVQAGAGLSKPNFAMPKGAADTRVFWYVSRAAMEYNHGRIGAADAQNSCKWIEDNAFGTYPNGAMIKADLGSPADPGLASGSAPAPTVVVLTPSVAAGCFKTSGGVAYDAFSDVSARIDYFPAPGLMIPDTGNQRVGWYKPTYTDASYSGAYDILATARVSVYNPTTQVFTDEATYSGVLASITDLGSGGSGVPDYLQIVECALYEHDNKIFIWSVDGGSAGVAASNITWLAHFDESGGGGGVVDVIQNVSAFVMFGQTRR